MAITVQEFHQRLVESGLISAEQLERFFEPWPEERRPKTAQQLAAALCRAGLLTVYQANQIAKGQGAKLILGEYIILDRLGGGGMGEVFKARHRTMDRIVALKLIKPSEMQSPAAVERFRREVRAAAKLMHPNIVLAYDAGEAAGQHYLVMEYVEGKDLGAVLREQGPLSVQGAVECILQAARGLHYAHQRGVIHRDIKPGNLLLSQDGVVKILDLGLARLKPLQQDQTATGDRLTQTGLVVGTVDYMAPEQIRHTHQVDHRADIYSLGCTLYRLLTGKPIYEGESAIQVLVAHLEAPIPSLSQARPDVPVELELAYQKMVAKRPEDRYQSMAEVIEALEGVLEALGVSAKQEAASAESSVTDSALKAFLDHLKRSREVELEETAAWEPSTPKEGTRLAAGAGPAVAPGAGAGALAGLTKAAGTPAGGKAATSGPPPGPTVSMPIPPSVAQGSAGPTPPPLPRKPTPAPPPTAPGKQKPGLPEGKPAGLAGWWAGLRLALGQMPGWVWGLAAALPVLLAAVVVVLVVVFRQQPVRETARAGQPKSAKGPVVTPSQPEQKTDSQQAVRSEGPAQPSTQPEAKPTGPQQKPQPTGRLVLHWPKAERQDGKLDLDGLFQDIEKLADPQNPDQLKLLLPEGEHTIWLARRGYEPIEQTVRVQAGQEVSVRPQWRPAPALPTEPLKPETKPEEKPAAKPEEKPAKPEEKPGAEPPTKPELPPGPPAIQLAWEKLEGQLRQWEAQEAEFNQKVEPVEELARQWQFAQAAQKAKSIQFAQPDLHQRWQVRQQELQWLAEWKERIIQKIRSAASPVQKSQLGLRGVEGQVVEVDEEKITCQLAAGKPETLAWNDLGPRAPWKLVGFVIDQSNPEELLKAAVFLASVGQAAEATRYFSQAQEKGLPVQEHLELASYGLVRELVGKLRAKEYSAAQAALDRLEAEAGLAPWRTKHKELLDGIRGVLAEAKREAEAEKLYAEAVKLYKEQELHDVKAVVERLQKEYADTTPVLDTARQPPLAELQKATAGLGRRITVRQDGKGDFRSIQAAIDAARPGSYIQIEDSGIYNEQIIIPKEKNDLMIRGVKGKWPLITSMGPKRDFEHLIQIQSPSVALERLLIFHGTPKAGDPSALALTSEKISVRVRLGFVCVVPPASSLMGRDRIPVKIDVYDSIFIGNITLRHSNSANMYNSLWIGHRLTLNANPSEFRHCILLGVVDSETSGYVFVDSILLQGRMEAAKNRFERCVILKEDKSSLSSRDGIHCFSADPMFRDPANLDYRLKPGSPCIGKASDGGDIGVRWTPEMLEMVQVALELRRRGLIKF